MSSAAEGTSVEKSTDDRSSVTFHCASCTSKNLLVSFCFIFYVMLQLLVWFSAKIRSITRIVIQR